VTYLASHPIHSGYDVAYLDQLLSIVALYLLSMDLC